jgi:hypothetical protein
MERRLQKQWVTFAKAMALEKCSKAQRTDMRRAFMGGAASMLDVTTRLGEPGTPEHRGVQILEELHDELRHFANDLKTGKA